MFRGQRKEALEEAIPYLVNSMRFLNAPRTEQAQTIERLKGSTLPSDLCTAAMLAESLGLVRQAEELYLQAEKRGSAIAGQQLGREKTRKLRNGR